MNLLVFVFSLLLIFSYSFFISFEKFNGERRIRSTYLGHMKANRKIYSAYENELYKSFPSKPNPVTESKPHSASTHQTEPRPPKPNGDCSRINIAPLLKTGIEENRVLYDLVAKLFKTFYGELFFHNKPKAEYKFLDAFLKVAKLHESTPIEKFDLKNPELQEIYYQMLKGTKKTIPSLLDYITIDSHQESRICLFHAHPRLIAVIFGEKPAQKIFNEMHQVKARPITQEVIERLCSEVHAPILQPEIFNLLQLGKPSHKPSAKRALVQTDSESAITLRKDLYVHRT